MVETKIPGTMEEVQPLAAAMPATVEGPAGDGRNYALSSKITARCRGRLDALSSIDQCVFKTGDAKPAGRLSLHLMNGWIGVAVHKKRLNDNVRSLTSYVGVAGHKQIPPRETQQRA